MAAKRIVDDASRRRTVQVHCSPVPVSADRFLSTRLPFRLIAVYALVSTQDGSQEALSLKVQKSIRSGISTYLYCEVSKINVAASAFIFSGYLSKMEAHRGLNGL